MQAAAASAAPPVPSPPAARDGEDDTRQFRTSDAGITGILRRQERDAAAADRDLSEAFEDLNALMEKASAMVKLAGRLKTALNKSDAGAGGEEKQAQENVHGWLLSLGVDSPVTKDMAGALYHQQLSRQLADFLLVPPPGSSRGAPLAVAGGMLSLVDVWCVYNRARGTALVSPEDVRKACELWPKLGVPLVLRSFASGSLAVAGADFDDDVVAAKLLLLAASSDEAMV